MLGFGILPANLKILEYTEGTSIFHVVISMGEDISNESTKAFAEGDYRKGMLSDAMAGAAKYLKNENEKIFRVVTVNKK